LLSNGIVSHFDIMKVSNRFSSVVKVITHFPRARLPSVAILTNISNCMPNSKVRYSTSTRKKLAVTSVDLIAKQGKKCWNTNYCACITWNNYKTWIPRPLKVVAGMAAHSRMFWNRLGVKAAELLRQMTMFGWPYKKLKKTSIKHHIAALHCKR